MDLTSIMDSPLLAGLVGFFFGLIVALIVKVKAWFARRALEKENAALLRTHLMMHDAGNKALSAELESLKKQNENLRVTLTTLKTKTDKSELRTLHVYDKAIRLMITRAPGFAPVWETTLAEAEAEMQQVDNGMMAWIKKTIRPSLGNTSQQASAALSPPLSGSVSHPDPKQ